MLSKYLTDHCCCFLSLGLVLHCTEKLVIPDWTEVVTFSQVHRLQAKSSVSSKIGSGKALTLLLTDLSFTENRCSGQFSYGDPITGIWGKKLGEGSIIYFHFNEWHFSELSSSSKIRVWKKKSYYVVQCFFTLWNSLSSPVLLNSTRF